MKKFSAFLLRIISNIFERIAGKREPEPVRCQFCGETGHDTDECPKSAKYKLFHIDRD